MAAGSSERTSLLAELRKAAAVGDDGFYSYELWECFQVAEGSAEVALRMGSELGERVRLGAVVSGISVSRTGCHVTLDTGEVISGEAVVCALPVSVLHGIEIDGVSPERLASLRAQRQAHGGEGRHRLRPLHLGRPRRERPLRGRAPARVDVAAA